MFFRINEKTNEVCFDIKDFVRETNILDEEKAFQFLREVNADVVTATINATYERLKPNP